MRNGLIKKKNSTHYPPPPPPPPQLLLIFSSHQQYLDPNPVSIHHSSGCPRKSLWDWWASVDEHFFIFALFLWGSAGFLLGIWVVGELWRASGHWAAQHQLLEVVEHHAVLLGQEGDSCALFTRTTRSTNAMSVVCTEEQLTSKQWVPTLWYERCGGGEGAHMVGSNWKDQQHVLLTKQSFWKRTIWHNLGKQSLVHNKKETQNRELSFPDWRPDNQWENLTAVWCVTC